MRAARRSASARGCEGHPAQNSSSTRRLPIPLEASPVAAGYGAAVPHLARNWLHLAALWTLGVCLPLLQVISHSPDWLVAEHAGFPDLPLTVILLVVGPPSAVVLVEWLLGRVDERAANVAHLVAVGGLV